MKPIVAVMVFLTTGVVGSLLPLAISWFTGDASSAESIAESYARKDGFVSSFPMPKGWSVETMKAKVVGLSVGHTLAFRSELGSTVQVEIYLNSAWGSSQTMSEGIAKAAERVVAREIKKGVEGDYYSIDETSTVGPTGFGITDGVNAMRAQFELVLPKGGETLLLEVIVTSQGNRIVVIEAARIKESQDAKRELDSFLNQIAAHIARE